MGLVEPRMQGKKALMATSGWLRSTTSTLEMIKWEHSIFALPFALTGAMLAASGWPNVWALFWIVVCMVSARSSAMAFNRIVDAQFDAENPRTATRAIPSGQLDTGFVWVFVVVSGLVFIAASAMLNRLALEFAPLALGIILGYSYMKRYTRWTHVVLGLALGIAPSAAWIAIRGSFDARILLLTGVVISWVGGFDVLYACQDIDYDRQAGLKSIPAWLGLEGAFWFARGMHVLTVICMLSVVRAFHLATIGYAGVSLVALLLMYEHSIVAPNDLRRMNAAFFTINGVISIVYFLFVAGAILLKA